MLIMEGLNALLKLADAKGLLKLLHHKVKERTFLYADDVVVFLSPVQQDLTSLKLILEIFAGASGLKTNLSKCMISSIQCDLEATVTFLSLFPGKIDPFPTRYLGISAWCKKTSQA